MRKTAANLRDFSEMPVHIKNFHYWGCNAERKRKGKNERSKFHVLNALKNNTSFLFDIKLDEDYSLVLETSFESKKIGTGLWEKQVFFWFGLPFLCPVFDFYRKHRVPIR